MLILFTKLRIIESKVLNFSLSVLSIGTQEIGLVLGSDQE